MFEDQLHELSERIGLQQAQRVFLLVVTLDALERNKAAGLQPWEKPPPGSADDVREELRRVLELSDEQLVELAAMAEDAANHAAKAVPPPGRN